MIRCYTTLLSAPVDRDSSPQAEATEAKLQAEQRAPTKLEYEASDSASEVSLGRRCEPTPNSQRKP